MVCWALNFHGPMVIQSVCFKKLTLLDCCCATHDFFHEFLYAILQSGAICVGTKALPQQIKRSVMNCQEMMLDKSYFLLVNLLVIAKLPTMSFTVQFQHGGSNQVILNIMRNMVRLIQDRFLRPTA
jgi:hypothetical protein